MSSFFYSSYLKRPFSNAPKERLPTSDSLRVLELTNTIHLYTPSKDIKNPVPCSIDSLALDSHHKYYYFFHPAFF